MSYGPEAESVGIGIFLAPNRTGQFMITKIAPDGPAFRTQQIQVGDLLVQVDDRILDGMHIEEVRQCITGPPNSQISLRLLRPHVNMESGFEEFDPINVRLRRSTTAHQSYSDTDLSPREYEARPHNAYSSTNGPRVPSDSNAQPIVGQTFAQFTPSKFQPLQDAVYGQEALRAPSLLTPQPYAQRNLSPSRGPGPTLRGGISAGGVLMDPSRVYGISPPKQQAAQAPAIYSTDPQYSTVRRSISAPDPRQSWQAGGDAWEPQGPIIPRHMTPQGALPQARRRGMSPGAPGIGLFGIGIVLQNDPTGELRVVDITPGGPADVQGCPFKPGDVVAAIDGRNVRRISAMQARELVLGRHSTPVQVKVLRPLMGSGLRGSLPQFQPISYVLYRGVNSGQNGISAAASAGFQPVSGFAAVRTPSPMRPSPGPLPATAPQPRTQGVNEHMCGIGVFIERVRGSLIVKSINPNGPAGQVSPTYLFPGDYLVAIDGKNTQNMTMQEVRNQIIGKRGTYVTLSLRRFIPSTGETSHVFETRVQRELHPAPVSPGHSAHDDHSAGPRQGPVINQMHDNVDMRGTAQPYLSESSANGTNTVGTIGIQLMEVDHVLMVRDLDRGGPADRCGLISVGDVLHRIDYQKVEGLSVDEVQAMLSGPARSSVVLGFVKYRLHLRVNVRLSREIPQQPSAPRRDSPIRQKPVDLYAAAPRQETPSRGRTLDHYTTIYTSIEQPRASEQPRAIEPQRLAAGNHIGMPTPRYMALQPNMQFSGPYGERLRRPTPVLQHPFMFSPYHSVAVGNFVL